MTDAPKKRPWLQFHLSTAVVLMFVAGGLLWANSVPEHRDWSDSLYENSVTTYGWPRSVWVRHVDHLPRSPIASPFRPDPVSQSWSVSGVVVDAVVALTLTVVTGLFLECLIRRKERHQ
jgi:hypothetical protein